MRVKPDFDYPFKWFIKHWDWVVTGLVVLACAIGVYIFCWAMFHDFGIFESAWPPWPFNK